MHADGLIAEIDGGGAPTYHLTDALGSVRGLTNLAGTVTGTSDFDVFGDFRTQTGAASIFDFTGEQRDVVTGMTYLRARYYESGYGRFVSADTVVPGGPGTQGFNRYAYVGNNPCTATDPTGHFPGGGPNGCIVNALSFLSGFMAAVQVIQLIVAGVSFGVLPAIVVAGLMIIAALAAAAFIISVFECLALILALALSAASDALGPGDHSGEPGDSGHPPRPTPPIPPLPLPIPKPTPGS